MITDNGFKMSVIAASRYWGNDMNDTNNTVLAQGFGYEYDPIGNRKTATGGTTSTSSAYTANNLNQYTERTVPGKFPVLGSASEDAYVTVSLTNAPAEPADRQGKYWHKALEVDNTSAAVYPEIKVVGVYNPQSAGMPDVVSEEVGRKFITKTPEQFTYDADGNMTSDGRYTYTWDAENRLIAVEAESRSGVPAAFMKRLDFAYDYMSRRISKKLYRRQGQDWASTPQKEIAYIYDGCPPSLASSGAAFGNLICESIRETKSSGGGGGGGGQGGGGKGKGQGQGQASGGSVSISTNYYVWGLDLSGSLQGASGIGGLLCVSQSGTGVSPVSYFPTFDANGNVSELINPQSEITNPQFLAAHYEYSPFGEIIVATGSKKDDFPFRFSTKYLDQETGLYDYGLRYYSPGLGRWLNRDPIEERGGLHVYSFVYNNPVGRFDRIGLDITGITFSPQGGDLHGTIEANKFPSLGRVTILDSLCAANDPNCSGSSRDNWGEVKIDWSSDWATRNVRATLEGWTDFSKSPSGTDQLAFSAYVEGTVSVQACCDSGKIDVSWSASVGGNPNQKNLSSEAEAGESSSSTTTTLAPSGGNNIVTDAGSFTTTLSRGKATFFIRVQSTWRDDGIPAEVHSGSAVLDVFVACKVP